MIYFYLSNQSGFVDIDNISKEGLLEFMHFECSQGIFHDLVNSGQDCSVWEVEIDDPNQEKLAGFKKWLIGIKQHNYPIVHGPYPTKQNEENLFTVRKIG
jgi:hypothetical protein